MASAVGEAAPSLEGNILYDFSKTPAASPPFDSVTADMVVPAMRQLLKDLEEELTAVETDAVATWSGFVEPLERIVDKMSSVWGVCTHLKAVKDTEALRKAVEEIIPERVNFSLRMSQSKALYKLYEEVRNGPEWESLTEAQQRLIDSNLKEAKLQGVGLEGDAQEQFNKNQKELAQLSTTFSNNLLDATKAYKKFIEDPADVAGIPKTALALAAQTAVTNGKEGATADNGPWCFTLDIPSYLPVMQHCKNRALREEMYTTYLSKASSGERDNTPHIKRILELRKEQAKLLGFENYAQVSMEQKMATFDGAEELLEELRRKSYDAAVKDLEDVKAFAREQGAAEADDLRQWDVAFWAERLKEAKYTLEDEQLRPYFALPAVLDGLFGLIDRIFGVQIAAADGEVPVWHKDVRYFKVSRDGEPVAAFYLDPYSRPEEKRGGAWMDEVCSRSRILGASPGSPRLPVAHMVCNQSPPVGDEPSLMRLQEVETLFHEMGHALQHMLTKQDEGLIAGIRGVEWDAVELPSQFMENWVYDEGTLKGFAKHYQTGDPLPQDLYDKIIAAKNYRAGTMMLRQLHFAMLDLELHSRYDPDGPMTVHELDREVGKKTQVMPPIESDRFLCGFAHIFAGGYSAGYYSYKWAEVLSADAFSAFEEDGLDNDEAVKERGRLFADTVLGLGGGAHPSKVFEMFRGRGPSTDAILRHAGLATPQPAAA